MICSFTIGSFQFKKPTNRRLAVVLGVLLLAGSTVVQAQSDYATPYAITTLAGSAGVSGSTDGTGSAARFYNPGGLAVDGGGNIYVADTGNNTIRKITPGGQVTTLAGSASSHGSLDGTGSAAEFDFPIGIAVDGSGNLYVADGGNNTIRMITPGGVVTTLAGRAGGSGVGSSDGTGSAARFNYPESVALDGSGNLYVADCNNNTIRKITAGGVVTTFAGSAGSYGSSDGTGSAARFDNPHGLAIDGSGNIYVADIYNDTIRKITPGGVVTTLAGSAGNSGRADGLGSAARFYYPIDVAVDGGGSVYVADAGNSIIRKITPGGVVTTLAGGGSSGDATGSAAGFNVPHGVKLDGSGNFYVADYDNDTIRKGTLSPDLFGGIVAGVNLNDSSWFGYYTTLSYPQVYQYSLGYEYVYNAGGGAVYLYDYKSGHFWYTSSSYFPFVYDFTLNAYLYYYSGNGNPRYFQDYGTTPSHVISE